MSQSSYFGFQPVEPEEKTTLVQDVFNRVASKYDLMNDLMSLGLHRYWKDQLVQTIQARPGQTILDMAGGTGDIAFRLLRPFQRQAEAPQVIICDRNAAMLEVGQDRAVDQGILHHLSWLCGDATAIPLPDQSLDVYTIAFGLRNVTDIPAALKEAHRVLKPGGRFFCLEFSQVTLPVLKSLYQTYTLKFLPYLGEWVAKDGPAYRYLAESIATFPDAPGLRQLLVAAGFNPVEYDLYSGGIVALHQARR